MSLKEERHTQGLYCGNRIIKEDLLEDLMQFWCWDLVKDYGAGSRESMDIRINKNMNGETE